MKTKLIKTRTKINNILQIISFGLLVLLILISVSCKIEDPLDNNIKDDGSVTTGQEEIQEEIPAGSTEGTSEEDAGQESILDEEDILAGFIELSGQGQKPNELIQYINDNIEKVGQETAEIMLEIFEKSQRSYKDTYMNILLEGDFQQSLIQVYGSEVLSEEINKISEGDLKDLLAELFDGGYKLISLEGSYYPFIDHGFFKRYYDFVSMEFKDYYEITASESDNIYSMDAGLVISWDEIAERLIDSEDYLINYPSDSIRKVEISRLYMNYLSAYLYGQNNTPSRDYMTNRVLEEVVSSYREIVKKYQQTITGGIISDYLGLLEGTDYILTDDLLGEINQYFIRPIGEYGLDSYYMLEEQVKNLYYSSEFAANGYIKLSDGSYREKYDQESAAELIINLADIISIGDLGGDGINDAAVILISDPGGSGTFYTLQVVINGYFFLYSAAEDFLGDRIRIEDIFIEDQKIYIDMVIHKEDDPLCCPSNEVSRAYLIEDNELIKLIVHTGLLETATGQYINIILDDGVVLEIMLDGYNLPSGITEGDEIYVEYYADYIAEQNILYLIDKT